jgi:hypothetical protein
LNQQLGESVFDAVAPQPAHTFRCGADEHAGLPVVGGDQTGPGAGAIRPLVAIGWETGDVAVEHRGARYALAYDPWPNTTLPNETTTVNHDQTQV